MSDYNREQSALHRELLQEIAVEKFMSSFHEMKKKMTILDSKVQGLTEKLKDYESQLERYKKLHTEDHRTKISRSNAETQT